MQLNIYRSCFCLLCASSSPSIFIIIPFNLYPFRSFRSSDFLLSNENYKRKSAFEKKWHFLTRQDVTILSPGGTTAWQNDDLLSPDVLSPRFVRWFLSLRKMCLHKKSSIFWIEMIQRDCWISFTVKKPAWMFLKKKDSNRNICCLCCHNLTKTAFPCTIMDYFIAVRFNEMCI